MARRSLCAHARVIRCVIGRNICENVGAKPCREPRMASGGVRGCAAMSFAITARMASVPVMLACFTDEALLRGALAFERALAAASAEHGVIGADAAAAIAAACERFDGHGMADAAAHAGTL